MARVIESIEDLSRCLTAYPSTWIFRGHAQSSFRLVPNLYRRLPLPITNELAELAEEYALIQFKSKFHLYAPSTPLVPEGPLEWLAMMQHYGVPTRLLNFTASPFVALYFALEGAVIGQKETMTIWALNYREILEKSLSIIQDRDRSFPYGYKDTYKKADEVFEHVLQRFRLDMLWVAEPARLNPRIDRQAGTFVLSGNPEISIDDLLESNSYQGMSERIEIPIALYREIYEFLKRINVTPKTIYGDIEGLAKEIALEVSAQTEM